MVLKILNFLLTVLITLLEELKETRTKELEEQEDDITWTEAKRLWKDDHPNHTLKSFKEKYLNGEIDELPWAKYKSDLLEDNEPEGYIQNAEQNEKSIWKRIGDK